jgi:ubiquinone/menaquinone biosynthesis C-methylase UbiE
VLGLEPSQPLLARARTNAELAHVPVQLIEGSAEAIPLDDRCVDTAVMTWTACSIPDIRCALAEMRRVLRPSGRLLFVEHGQSPDPRVQVWQDRLTPLWRRVAGGCHLNRKMDDLIQQSGFTIERLDTGYIRGPKIMTFIYEGSAKPR